MEDEVQVRPARRARRPQLGVGMRAALAVAALGLALSLIWLAHRYLIARLVAAPGWPAPLGALLACAIWALGAAMLLQPAAERLLPVRVARALAWPAYVWMGAFFVTLCTTLASDALVLLLGAARPEALADALVTSRARALGVLALAGAATMLGVRSALRPPRVRRVEIAPARWPAALDGYRIVQISDVHIGPLLGRRFAQAVVERVNALRGDLVAVTGDLVDGSVERLRDEVAPFGALRAAHGVYFVTGNHDWYSGAREWVAETQALGMRVLRNERVAIGTEPAVFDLAGVDDQRGDWMHGSPCDPVRALAGRDARRAVVLLAHDPTTFAKASRLGVDLQLSGHTHGGQIWPFRYFVRLVVPWVEGLHRRGASLLYVSRGTGFWGPPLRLFAPAEITEITLRAGG